MRSQSRVVCFLPCRSGSQRVPNKNVASFAGVDGGLTAIKLSQLSRCEAIDQVLLSTNDPKVEAVAQSMDSLLKQKIKIVPRPEPLGIASTSTDDLVGHVIDITSSEPNQTTILWTHVTSPFFDGDSYSESVRAYFEKVQSGDWDSLMSVTPFQDFIWSDAKPLNYDPSIEKWPRTQTLPRWYKVNSGVFISSVGNYRSYQDRIGKAPFLYPTDDVIGFDIDWPDDFALAEFIWTRKGLSALGSATCT